MRRKKEKINKEPRQPSYLVRLLCKKQAKEEKRAGLGFNQRSPVGVVENNPLNNGFTSKYPHRMDHGGRNIGWPKHCESQCRMRYLGQYWLADHAGVSGPCPIDQHGVSPFEGVAASRGRYSGLSRVSQGWLIGPTAPLIYADAVPGEHCDRQCNSI